MAMPTIQDLLGGKFPSDTGSLLGTFDKVPWKTPEQLVAESTASNLSSEESAYGKVLPIVRGSVYLPCYVIWQSPVREVFTDTTSGKGGTSTSETFDGDFVDVALAICDNTLHDTIKLLRLWADKTTCLLDFTTGNSTTTNEVPHFRFYHGNNNDIFGPDPTILAAEGADSTPAFINTCYLVLHDFNITSYGGRVPLFSVEISATSADNTRPEKAIPQNAIGGAAAVYDDRSAIDWVHGHIYSFLADDDYATNAFTIITLSLDTEKEIRRVKIHSAGYEDYTHALPLFGSPYILYSAKPDGSGAGASYNVIIDTETGLIVATDSADPTHNTEWVGARIIGGKTSSYLLIGRYSSGSNGVTVARFDVANKSLHIINRDYTRTNGRVFSWGPAKNGRVRFYGTKTDGSIVEITYVGGTLAAHTMYDAGASAPDGVYYDGSDDSVIISGDNYLKKVTRAGVLVYNANPVGGTYQAIIGGKFQKFPGPLRYHWADTYQGHALLLVNGTAAQQGVYKVDTSDGSLE